MGAFMAQLPWYLVLLVGIVIGLFIGMFWGGHIGFSVASTPPPKK